jgi:hypothetical protein
LRFEAAFLHRPCEAREKRHVVIYEKKRTILAKFGVVSVYHAIPRRVVLAWF